MVYFTQIFR